MEGIALAADQPARCREAQDDANAAGPATIAELLGTRAW
jgi:hypothetical protein